MMSNRRGSGNGSAGIKQWASSQVDAAAGSQTVNISLPAGQVGRPVKLKAGGAVNALVSISFGNNSDVSAIVNPNAPADVVDIPASGFPSPTNSVAVTLNASAAGYVTISIGFA